MLLSMTGHGESHVQQDGLSVAVEMRTINNRYFKVTVRAGEGYSSLELRIESLVREKIKRGTVQVGLRIERQAGADDYRLNEAVITGYRQQLERIYDQLHVAESIHLQALLSLPGVVIERADDCADPEAEWPIIERALLASLENLQQMRIQEGRAMTVDLIAQCKTIATELEKVAVRAPNVVEAYRARLTERLSKLLAEFNVSIQASDVIREVGLFAERSDISEEIVRLRSHLGQFDEIARLDESSGRKLEFLTQEMFREANTIGSKANDAEIARHVIEIKAAIERMREMIQNVE